MIVRVVSYNLLVPVLAEEPEYFYKCHPKHINRNYRLRVIQSELQREITQHDNTIICLQELCRTTVPILKNFFRRQHYHLIHRCYGEQFNDYMGVGIAIPNSMRKKNVSFINVGHRIRAQLTQKRTMFSPLLGRLGQCFRGNTPRPAYDPWTIAMNKKNILIFIEVMIHRIPLCIGTYHMPCLYKNPDVMLIHATMVNDLMFELADGRNMILAGDFNLKPTDKCYRAITESGYGFRHLPKSNLYRVRYRSDGNNALSSAYAEKNGSEPSFTAFSSTPKSPDFRATMDYIFFSGRLQVTNVLGLPDDPTSESFPDAEHPSDHLMIAATFRLH